MADTPSVQTSTSEDVVQSLEKRVTELSGHLTELQQLMRTERQLRWLTVVLILVIVGVLAYMTVHAVVNINTDELSQLAQKRYPFLMDNLQYEFQEYFKKAEPKLRAAIQEKIEKHGPALKKVAGEELEKLMNNLPARIEKQVADRFSHLDPKLERMLRQDFPELTDAQIKRMYRNLEMVLWEACVELADEHLQDHIALLVTLEKDLERFDPGPDRPTEAQAVQEFKSVLLELLEMKLPRMLDVDSVECEDTGIPAAQVAEDGEEAVPTPSGETSGGTAE